MSYSLYFSQRRIFGFAWWGPASMLNVSNSPAPFSIRKWAWLRRILVIIVATALLLGVLIRIDRRAPLPATPIFAGITYGCDRIENSEQGSGLFHWVRVDLTTPGIELYIT